eukprot:TRINITY_DN2972_c0_g1_i1.p1 TRINITY_DN2972_c0_g1~~TRINITY_DN2972_c0_g1_i1.p1  ORF type:complete len:157 (+),score=35.88 TRINITY_DN2972_c0_g1_i1:54-524(+)
MLFGKITKFVCLAVPFVVGVCGSVNLYDNTIKQSAKNAINCEDPICFSRRELFEKMMHIDTKKKVEKSDFEEGSESVLDVLPRDLPPRKPWCPVDRDELGQMSWTILHSFAAYYPDEPTEEDKQAAVAFMQSFTHLYPCVHCRSDFKEAIAANPPR